MEEETDLFMIADKLQRAIRCLEASLSNVSLADCLLQRGVVDLLLSLFDIKIPHIAGHSYEL